MGRAGTTPSPASPRLNRWEFVSEAFTWASDDLRSRWIRLGCSHRTHRRVPYDDVRILSKEHSRVCHRPCWRWQLSAGRILSRFWLLRRLLGAIWPKTISTARNTATGRDAGGLIGDAGGW
jgi:hypothetical protein